MTSTDELRRLLDERGVEWVPYSAFSTLYTTPDGKPVRADGDFMEGRVELYVRNLTPEQAVEATLGSDLQAENADLRRELELDEPLFETLNAANDALLAENAKLRELCRMLFDELYTLIDDNCSDVYTQYERSDVQPFYDELRELGVEVDV